MLQLQHTTIMKHKRNNNTNKLLIEKVKLNKICDLPVAHTSINCWPIERHPTTFKEYELMTTITVDLSTYAISKKNLQKIQGQDS